MNEEKCFIVVDEARTNWSLSAFGCNYTRTSKEDMEVLLMSKGMPQQHANELLTRVEREKRLAFILRV